MNNFDYKKAKEEAEKMLEVIERDPQISWTDTIGDLTKSMYTLAMAQITLSMMAKSINK